MRASATRKTGRRALPARKGKNVTQNDALPLTGSTSGVETLKSASSVLRLGLATVVVLAGGFGSWAVMAEISGAVIASGHIAVEPSQHTVQHADGGTAARILVRNGDTVQKGDLLARLDDTDLLPERTRVRDQVFALRARMSRLLAEQAERHALTPVPAFAQAMATDEKGLHIYDTQAALFTSRRDSLAQQIATIRERVV
jgi:HlyD family secretion protein